MDYPEPKVIISLREFEDLIEAKESFDKLSDEHLKLKEKHIELINLHYAEDNE